jgi:large subunit ribosomal protein L5e
MPFVKVVKNKAFFKRFQVRLRRRRQGKTDFHARRKLVTQEKNKYNSPKYRLVVRRSNKRIVCQITYATIEGDRVVTQANSQELPRYGVKVGLTNYAACYCTGLLVARRCLKKLGLDSAFEGVKEATGEEYHVEEECDDEKRPFKALLDVGIVRTTSGARCFGALKGAVDGGLHVPHSCKLFPGYTPAEDKTSDAQYDAEVHKARIMGGHVSEYMEMLKEEDPTKYEAQFAKYVKEGIEADDMEQMYKDCHAKIRANPDAAPKKASKGKPKRSGNKVTGPGGKSYTRSIKLSLKQRKEKVKQKIMAALSKGAAGDDE